MFPKGTDQVEGAIVKKIGVESNRITIRKIFDAERKELADKPPPVSIL
jgi:hypothetical protein